MVTVINGNNTRVINSGRQLDGEKIFGDLKNWDYFGTDPNDILTFTYDILAQRSTTLYHTYGPVASAVNKLKTYTIGKGLRFVSQPDFITLGISKNKAKSWAKEFQRLIDYVFRVLNFYQKQSLIFSTAEIMGDSLLLFDREYDEFPFDLIEAGGDEINFDANPELSNGLKCTLGIVHDKYKRKKSVCMHSEKKPINYRDDNGDQNVIQYYDKHMSRQLRGYPLAYRIISLAKNHDRFYDATLQRAVMESIILGWSETQGNTGYRSMEQAAKDALIETTGTSQDDYSLKKEGNIADLGPGNVFSWNRGDKMNFTDLKTPSNNFADFDNACIDHVGMATEVPPEVIKSKYSTSYTAHKGAFNDFIQLFNRKRGNFVNIVGKKVLLEAAKVLFMKNMIDVPNIGFFENPIIQEATIAGNWLGPVPGHINPLPEVNAKKIAVEQAFQLRSQVALEYGNDFDMTISEWQDQQREWQSMSTENQASIIQNEVEEQNI